MAEIPDDELKAQFVKVVAEIQELARQAAAVRAEVAKQRTELAELARLTASARDETQRAITSATREAADIESVRLRISEAMRSIEEDTRKANSESGFAYNAKNNAEEHAKAIAQVRGTVEATFSALTANKASIDELVKAVSALRAAAETDGREIGELKAEARRDSQAAKAALERTNAVMPAIEKGASDANSISAAKSEVDANLAVVKSTQAQMAEILAAAVTDGTSLAKLEAEARGNVAGMAETLATAKTADAKVADYQNQLRDMQQAFEAMKAKLEGLLPHATSAGLASAFHIQKGRFSKPQRNWLALFVATIAALLLAGLWGLPASNDTWDAIVRHFVNRLPIVAPLVWLAIYAGHHYNMALRMEEDYAFKEAVSTAFEGYKREMQDIQPANGSSVSPLVTLCENVLGALAERPGRIYDGRSDVVTPITPAVAAVKEIVSEALGKGQKP